MTTIEIILKWGIRNDLLAAKIGMTKQCFNNKIKGKLAYARFKDEENNKLTKVLKELAKDIKEVK